MDKLFLAQGMELNGGIWTTGGSISSCYCRTFRLPCLNCNLTMWRVNVLHFCEANRSANLYEIWNGRCAVKVARAESLLIAWACHLVEQIVTCCAGADGG
jgi:hypothetical protein